MKAMILAIIIALLPYQLQLKNMPHQIKPKCVVCGHKADVSFCLKHYESEVSKNIREAKTLFKSSKEMHNELFNLHKKMFSEEENTFESMA